MMAEIFLLLMFGHALADYPLQGDFIAKAKNHKIPIQGVPFYQALLAHSIIHGGFVLLITGSVWLCLSEILIHAATDYAKCNGNISFNQDQIIHVLCKVLWTCIVV